MEKKVFKSRFANKRSWKWALFAKGGEKNWLIVFWAKIRKFRPCPHGHRKKSLNVSKTKPVVPRGHPLLLLLFFQNKSCMHNKVGTCTEILPSYTSTKENCWEYTFDTVTRYFTLWKHVAIMFWLWTKNNFFFRRSEFRFPMDTCFDAVTKFF